MTNAFAKTAARRLMAFAVLISPAESGEWSAAMSAELEHIEGPFDALSWAAGCLGTALKQFCISFFSSVISAIETEGAMSKFAKISAVTLALGSILFLFAPTFQQGLKLTSASWHRSDSAWLAKMEDLGHKAEASHDAQTLAFVALQMRYSWPPDAQSERDKFADEAVQWDQDLTWIYTYMLPGQIGPEHHDPNDSRWLARLEAWAPDNAAVYALEAWPYRPDVRGLDPQADRALLSASPRWRSAMTKAFSATNYDSYLSASRELERDVARRDGVMELGNALVTLFGAVNTYDFDLYTKDFLLPAAADFEAKGDLKHAEENYAKVARLSALMQLHSASDSERFAASELQLDVDPKLEALYEKSGNSAAAQLVAYQLASAQQTKSRQLAKLLGEDWSSSRQLLDASVVQLSLLAMVLSLLMIASCGVYYGVRRLRSAKSPRRTTGFSRAGVFGAMLLFVSAITMYFGFAPYAAAFQRYLATPSPVDVPEYLLRFWGLRELPWDVINWFLGHPFRVYFWYTVIAVGGAIVVWILYRWLVRTFRHPAPVQPSA